VTRHVAAERSRWEPGFGRALCLLVAESSVTARCPAADPLTGHTAVVGKGTADAQDAWDVSGDEPDSVNS